MKIICILLIFLVACNNKSISKNTKESNIDSILIQRQTWLKNYALCACASEGYKQEGIEVIDYSYGVYRDIAPYDQKSYSIIDSIAKKIIEKTPALQIDDYNNKKPILKSCLEFYHSKFLDSVVHSFDAEMQAFILDDLKVQQ